MCLAGSLSAQSVSPDVIGSSGEVSQVGATSISWTIGEPLTETITGGGNQITQGFHQPSYLLVALDNPLTDHLKIDVFPNPATERVFLEFERGENSPLQIDLVSINGQIIAKKRSLELSDKLEFDLSGLSIGTYFLHIKSESGQFDAYKIQKIN